MDTAEKLIEYTAWHMDPPVMFGRLHFILLILTVAAAFLCAHAAKSLDDKGRIRLLCGCGWLLAAMEVYKQFFIWHVVNNGVYDWWYFPFQLCSVPMYMCMMLPLLSRMPVLRGSVLTFMTGYTFVSAAAALIYPQDFLRSYVTLTAHGFIWHGILLFISLTLILSGMPDLSRRGILRSVILFLLLCTAAVCINIYAEPLMRSASASGALSSGYAAMFYLNPYHISPQPVIDTIQESAGIPAGLALYIAAVTAAAVAADLGAESFIRRSGRERL